MLLHGWVLGELGAGTDEHGVFTLVVFLHDGIKCVYSALVLFVKLGVRHTR